MQERAISFNWHFNYHAGAPMYLPDHFAETDPARMTALILAAPLACIVAHTSAGLLANHIPLLLAPDGNLIGHIARANPMHEQIADGQEVLAVFQGPDAYVSPNFYPSKHEHHRHVPTWNYMVVHAHGTIRFQHDLQARRAAVGLLTREHERRVNATAAWRMADAPADYMAQMLDAIVAFRIDVQRLEGKSKLSPNRDARDHTGAIAGLHASGQTAIADEMASQGPPE